MWVCLEVCQWFLNPNEKVQVVFEGSLCEMDTPFWGETSY